MENSRTKKKPFHFPSILPSLSPTHSSNEIRNESNCTTAAIFPDGARCFSMQMNLNANKYLFGLAWAVWRETMRLKDWPVIRRGEGGRTNYPRSGENYSARLLLLLSSLEREKQRVPIRRASILNSAIIPDTPSPFPHPSVLHTAHPLGNDDH